MIVAEAIIGTIIIVVCAIALLIGCGGLDNEI